MATKKKAEAVVTSYKGFDNGWKCRDFQYEIGKTYTHDGEVRACSGGFHACEYPLDVLSYYPAAGSKFAIVEQGGTLDRHNEDSKIASSTLTVRAELDLHGLIKAAVEYTVSRAKPAKGATNSDEAMAVSNSGDYGAASNSGYRGAASNSGYRGAASNSGVSGAASNSGKHGIAADFSGYGRAMSDETGAIVCVARNDDGSIRHIRAAKVGDGIKAGVWYRLDEAGDFEEVR